MLISLPSGLDVDQMVGYTDLVTRDVAGEFTHG